MYKHGSLKSLLLLWENLASNQRYSPYVRVEDKTSFETRANNEGLTFLTVTLPTLGKALDAFHSHFEWTCPKGFRVLRIDPQGRCIPEFLGNAIQAALDGDSIAVDCVRQLTLIFYKYEVDYDARLREEFLQKFKETDAELPTLSVDKASNEDLSKLLRAMKRIIRKVLCNTDPRKIRPSHGGGATSCRTRNEDKHHTLRYFQQLDDVYPYDELFFFSPTHLIDRLDRLENAPVGVPQARVCLVPKDSRGPRVISCEPAELMFAQQGIMSLLYRTLETHQMTAGQINFADQTINRKLARLSSVTGEYATLDLSDASDRVSLDLVEEVFPEEWVNCFKACRSDTTVLPDKSVVKLRKFAPMGSACCFPVEALIFWSCAVATFETTLSSDPSLDEDVYGNVDHSFWKNKVKMYVYGDDIIIPRDLFSRVVARLELIGLVVNKPKSYSDGPFRESCGGDYHKGYDVTPVRVRKPLSSSVNPLGRAETGIVENADLANLFIAKFGEEDSWALVHTIEESLGYIFPRTRLGVPGTLRLDPALSNDVFFQRRWQHDFQRVEHRILCHSMDCKTVHPPNWEELHRMELARGSSELSRFETMSRIDIPDSIESRYSNPVKAVNKRLKPGQYADVHSARMKWRWTWLG